MTTGKAGNQTGRSTRRSKPAKPVTIDLKAEEMKAEPDSAASAAAPTGKSAKSVPETGTRRASQPQTKPSAETAVEAKPAEAVTSTKAEKDGDKGQGEKTGSEKPDSGKSAGAADAATSSGDAPAGKAGEPSPAAEVAGKTGKGGGGALTGGLVGGALALLAMLGIQYAGLVPSPGGSAPTGSQSAEVASEVGQLRTTVDQLSSTVSRLSVEGGDTGGLADLTARLDALEQNAGAQAGDANPAVAALEQRLDELSRQIEALGTQAGGAGSGESVAELETAMAELRSETSMLTAGMSGLEDRFEDIGARIAAVEAAQTEQAQALAGRLEEVETMVNAPGRDLAMARAIAVSGLKTAIDRGGSFASELEAFASVSPDDPAIGELRSFAASGVPTRAQLVEQFPDVANRLISAAEPVSQDAGLVERLWSSAQSVVKVRKVGDVEGDSVEAIAARIETRLKNGDLDGARAEWAKLPEPSRAAAEEYGKALAARAEVEKLLATVQVASPAMSGETGGGETDAAPKATE